MARRYLTLICAVGALLLLFTACGTEYNGSNVGDSIQDKIIERAFAEASDIIENDDNVYVDKVFYGSFTAADSDEFLALLKFKNNSHVGGFDRTVGVVFSDKEFDVIGYYDFMADDVTVLPLQLTNGKNLILYLGETVYQGVSTQTLKLYDITKSVWNELPLSYLGLEDGENCYVCNNGTLVIESYEADASGFEKSYSVAKWEVDTGTFVFQNDSETQKSVG